MTHCTYANCKKATTTVTAMKKKKLNTHTSYRWTANKWDQPKSKQTNDMVVKIQTAHGWKTK